MQIFALSFVLFLLAVAGMAIGVIAGRGSIKGSCGGLNNPEGCEFCGGQGSVRGDCDSSRTGA